jgi:hypothetical protein
MTRITRMEFTDTVRDWIGFAEVQAILAERGFPSSKPAVYRLLDEGMPRHQLVKRGRVRFDRREVVTWIDARCTSPTPGQVA